MNLEKQIYIRKSCRNYLDEEIDMDLIHEFMNSIKLLNGGVSYSYDIMTIDEVNNLARFSAPYYLAIYTDKKENHVDMGFIFQQLCLSDDFTRTRDKFKRKGLSKISDVEDEQLIPAQLAPSSINSQPWYFKHSDDGFDVYQVKPNFLKRQFVKKWNSIDVGIALAHMYVANEDTFEFFKKTDFKDIKGHTYVGSIRI